MQRGQESTTFETNFQASVAEYLSRTEAFVQEIHDGLLNLTQIHEELLASTRPAAEPSVTKRVARTDMSRVAGKRVLVVESVEKNRVLFGRYFQEYPLAITFVKSEADAESALAQHSYDLIVRDWNERLASGAQKSALIQDILAQIQN